MAGLLEYLRQVWERLQGKAPEIPSPPGMIKWSEIAVDKNSDGKTCNLTLKNLPLPLYLFSNPYDTNSMDGSYDAGHTGINSCSREAIKEYARVGAWISWCKLVGLEKKAVYHQIIEIGEDEQGWYCITRGLNCAYPDPYPIRLNEIQMVAYGVLWTEFVKEKSIYVS